MTTTFYAPPDAFQGTHVVLPEDEARHATRVLRLQPGDEIVVVDGEGGWHSVRLEHVTKKEAAGTVQETKREVGEEPYDITIGMALLKNRNRFETVLEKATELGVRRIVPLQSHRTQKENIREQRAHNILVAAMKQSGRSRLLRLDEPSPLEAMVGGGVSSLDLVCAMDAPSERTLVQVVRNAPDIERIRILVGPEGGFTAEELEMLESSGYQRISLGRRRLRAETAALTAAAGVMLIRQAANESV